MMPWPVKAEHGVVGQEAYAFATAPGQTNGAAFLTLMNHTDHDVKVLGAETSAASVAELHTHTMNDGVMQMRRVDHFFIEEGGQITLKPTGDHIMLMDLNAPLRVGDEFEMTLSFDSQDPIIVDVSVVAPGTTLGNSDQSHHDHSHH